MSITYVQSLVGIASLVYEIWLCENREKTLKNHQISIVDKNNFFCRAAIYPKTRLLVVLMSTIIFEIFSKNALL